jgi:hypothetical protein
MLTFGGNVTAVKRPRSVAVVLVVGLAAIAIAIVLVLAHAPPTVAGTNSVSKSQYAELNEPGALSTCQEAKQIPRGTSAIQVGAEGFYFNPRVKLKLFAGNRLLAEGRQIAGDVASTVTVKIGALAQAVADARVCLTVGPALEPIRYYGLPRHSTTPPTSHLEEIELELRYLHPGSKTWWSQLSSISYHIGFGRAPGGAAAVVLLLLLGLSVVALACRLTLTELP